MTSIGEALVQQLETRGVSVVFGIPGVHTVELYRGLAASGIRHVTPRHEQGAGFMADGYARVTGKPGVVFVITGPGLTNTLTPMAQARADSAPMLVVSGVNNRQSLGRGLGHLHELPAQQQMAATVALSSTRILADGDLIPALDHAFDMFSNQRGGPVHIEVPIDVMGLPFERKTPPSDAPRKQCSDNIEQAARALRAANSPVILAGGGARWSNDGLTRLAEQLNAPVIQTVNARGLMHEHPLCVPASPGLEAVRDLIRSSDVVLALGTELGPTDYDMYVNGNTPAFNAMIRVDICADQLARHPADVVVHSRVEDALPRLLNAIGSDGIDCDGERRAQETRRAAKEEIGEDMRLQLRLLEAIREAAPDAILVGDSTQPVYAGNLYYDHDRPGGWFNAATGFGALGFGIPAAIGAALASPAAQVICITGDGGAQFTLPELMVAKDENLPILFIIWNNRGYQEIETSMAAAGVAVVGCDPTPPDFEAVATSCDIPFHRCPMTPQALTQAIEAMTPRTGPALIEIEMNATQS
jgi:acetolactate synthase I/II/III large subunit